MHIYSSSDLKQNDEPENDHNMFPLISRCKTNYPLNTNKSGIDEV